MKHPHLPILLITLTLTACGTVKSIGHGAKWTYRKAADGVQGAGSLVKAGTSKIWPFGKSEKSPPTKSDPKSAPTPEPRVAPVPSYDASKLWVRDSDLGDQKKTAENTSQSLKDGWEVTGSKIDFLEEYPGTPPTMLRAQGSPARAVRKEGGQRMQLSAQEIHYRQDSGLLVLKGAPRAVIGNHQIVSQSPKTLLIISLEDGSFHANGPIKTSYIEP